MSKAVTHINRLLKSFNQTFSLECDIVEDGSEQAASDIKIKELKSDGAEFIYLLLETFEPILQEVAPDHEIIYNNEKGLILVKQVVSFVPVDEENLNTD